MTRTTAETADGTPDRTTGPLHLGVDLGTSSVKVVTLDAGGTVLDSATAAYPVHAPRTAWAETPAEMWWAAVTTACRALPEASRRRCAGIGLSGQMHGVVLTDDDGGALRPAVLHADARATAELDAYRALPPRVLARLANPLSPNMAGPVLLWLAEHEPALLARARWALQPKDWVRLQLTGRAAAEPSDASATLLHDVAGDTWDDEVVALLGIRRELLAPLLPSSSAVAGTLTDRAAAALGLAPGLPVAAGGGDTAVAALGSGLLGTRATQLSLGTGGQVVTALDAAGASRATDPAALAAHPPTTHAYRDVADGWYAMGAVLNGGLALDWVRTALGASWAELYSAAGHPGGPTAPVFVPHLVGERTPHLDPGLRASWSGLELSHTRTDLLRAALEGVAHTLRDALDALPGAGGDEPLRLAGGGTQDPAWRQLLADVLERPLRATSTSGASSRGAAVLGAVAAGATTTDRVRDAWSPPLGPVVEPRAGSGPAAAQRRERYRWALAALRTP